MPAHAAMIEKPLVFSPDMEVEKAIKEMKKRKQDSAGVVDEQGVLVGVFSIAVILQNLLPVSVAMSDGILLDMPIQAAPGIAKRLQKIYPLTVAEIMERKKISLVQPETPVWECVNKMLTQGSPIFVVEGANMKFIGIVNDRSVLEELQRLQESKG